MRPDRVGLRPTRERDDKFVCANKELIVALSLSLVSLKPESQDSAGYEQPVCLLARKITGLRKVQWPADEEARCLDEQTRMVISLPFHFIADSIAANLIWASSKCLYLSALPARANILIDCEFRPKEMADRRRRFSERVRLTIEKVKIAPLTFTNKAKLVAF